MNFNFFLYIEQMIYRVSATLTHFSATFLGVTGVTGDQVGGCDQVLSL